MLSVRITQKNKSAERRQKLSHRIELANYFLRENAGELKFAL